MEVVGVLVEVVMVLVVVVVGVLVGVLGVLVEVVGQRHSFMLSDLLHVQTVLKNNAASGGQTSNSSSCSWIQRRVNKSFLLSGLAGWFSRFAGSAAAQRHFDTH